MVKLNLRTLYLIFGVIILLIISVGCDHAADHAPNDQSNLPHNEEQQTTNMTTENDGNATLRAEPYMNPGISWEYSLDIEIQDGKIYINGVLYEESSSVPPVIIYSEGFSAHAAFVDEINNNQEMSNTLQKIKNSESCYLLETNQDCSTGKMISVYEIEGVYYFVRFFDNGTVMRIHYAPIE